MTFILMIFRIGCSTHTSCKPCIMARCVFALDGNLNPLCVATESDLRGLILYRWFGKCPALLPGETTKSPLEMELSEEIEVLKEETEEKEGKVLDLSSKYTISFHSYIHTFTHDILF